MKDVTIPRRVVNALKRLRSSSQVGKSRRILAIGRRYVEDLLRKIVEELQLLEGDLR